jgi:hypothetical protein
MRRLLTTFSALVLLGGVAIGHATPALALAPTCQYTAGTPYRLTLNGNVYIQADDTISCDEEVGHIAVDGIIGKQNKDGTETILSSTAATAGCDSAPACTATPSVQIHANGIFHSYVGGVIHDCDADDLGYCYNAQSKKSANGVYFGGEWYYRSKCIKWTA